MTITDIGELTILVDETHEDRVCERTPIHSECGGKSEAVMYVQYSCGDIFAYCLADYERARTWKGRYRCRRDPGGVDELIQTWPVTR